MRALPVSPPSPFAARLWRRQDLTNGRAAVDDITVKSWKPLCLAATRHDTLQETLAQDNCQRSSGLLDSLARVSSTFKKDHVYPTPHIIYNPILHSAAVRPRVTTRQCAPDPLVPLPPCGRIIVPTTPPFIVALYSGLLSSDRPCTGSRIDFRASCCALASHNILVHTCSS